MESPQTTPSIEMARTRMFSLMLEIAFAFAVPAVVGAIVGRKLDAEYGTGYNYTVGALAVTFIASWVFVIVRYQKASAALAAAKREHAVSESERTK